MENLILKYLSNDLSLEERHQLNKWLDENEINRKVLEKFELYWSMGKYDFNTAEAEVLNRVQSDIGQFENSQEAISAKAESTNWFKYIGYAASVLIILSTAFWGYTHYGKTESKIAREIVFVEKVTEAGQKLVTILPDGTKVKLNASSKLIVPSVFSETRREVELVGQAFFDVVRDESRPFTIKTADLQIEVLGTSFDVNVYADEAEEHVAVKTGLVKVVGTNDDQAEYISKGQMIAVSRNGDWKKIEQLDEEVVFGWHDQNLIFNDMAISEAFKRIEKWFGVEIIYKGELEVLKELYNARFDNPTLNQVMGSISHIYKFDYEIKNKKITVTQK